MNCFCDQPLFTCEDGMQPFYVRAAFSNGRYATLCKCTLEVKFRTFFSKTFYFTACYVFNGICFHENIKIKGIDIIFNSWEKFYLGKMPKNRNIEYKNSPIKIDNNVLFCIRDIPEYGGAVIMFLVLISIYIIVSRKLFRILLRIVVLV